MKDEKHGGYRQLTMCKKARR